MAITLNNATCGASTFTASGTSLTFAHTTNAGSNMCLFVLAFASQTISSMSYAGTDMGASFVSVSLDAGQSAGWLLKAPSTGTNNVVITLGTSGTCIAIAFTLNGVSQTTPANNTVNGYNGSNPLSATITSVNGSMGVLVIGDRGSDTNNSFTGSGGSTMIGSTNQTNWIIAGAYLASTGTSVSPAISYAGGGSNSPEYMGFNVNSAASDTSVTPGQGSTSVTGNQPSVISGTNTVIQTFVARHSGVLVPDDRIAVPNRKIFLPAMRKAA